jgi:hypothetical protein
MFDSMRLINLTYNGRKQVLSKPVDNTFSPTECRAPREEQNQMRKTQLRTNRDTFHVRGEALTTGNFSVNEETYSKE